LARQKIGRAKSTGNLTHSFDNRIPLLSLHGTSILIKHECRGKGKNK
jgi:hypothetical protein